MTKIVLVVLKASSGLQLWKVWYTPYIGHAYHTVMVKVMETNSKFGKKRKRITMRNVDSFVSVFQLLGCEIKTTKNSFNSLIQIFKNETTHDFKIISNWYVFGIVFELLKTLCIINNAIIVFVKNIRKLFV